MLGRFKNMGAKKPYLIYAMCDETFAVNNSAQIPADVDRGWFYFFVSLLNQVSWVAGATLGGIVGGRLTFDTTGLDFVMTALFVVIFVDQWLTTKRKSHMAALTGIVVPVICMALFGADNFMIPSLIAMLVMFIMLRPYLDDLKPEISLNDKISAPISENDVLGKATYSVNGVTYTTDVVASHSVEKSNFWTYMIYGFIIFVFLLLIYECFFNQKKRRKKSKKVKYYYGR